MLTGCSSITGLSQISASQQVKPIRAIDGLEIVKLKRDSLECLTPGEARTILKNNLKIQSSR